MRIVVQKFGGTSVATPAMRSHVIERIGEAERAGFSPVVVVSAMGRAGDPYATDTLLHLARSAGDPPLDAPAGTPFAARDLDLLLACGEVIAAVVLAGTLRGRGREAAALTGAQGGIVTDEQHGQARIVAVRPQRVWELLARGVIPVVAGFQGVTQGGELTTLGRGGSDTTAAALAVALRAEFCEIFTDVDGVKTADPRAEPEAITLQRLGYREVVEMAHLGAKVIHPRAVEISMEGMMPLKIRSTAGGGNGTCVSNEPKDAPLEAVTGDRCVTGVAHVVRLARVEIWSHSDLNAPDGALVLFQALAGAGISLDMIHVSPHWVYCVVAGDQAERAEQVLQEWAGARSGAPGQHRITVERGFAKVSAVGAGMHGVPGVMARVVRALAEADIPIFHSTDSHANISCLVREADAATAVRALHRHFGLGRRSGSGSSMEERKWNR